MPHSDKCCRILVRSLHRESKKYAIVTSLILTIAVTLSLLDRFARFFHCCREQFTRHILSLLLHAFGKLKNHKFCALFVHVKHVSNVTFYHLSNRYLSNTMKMSAKINTMQNTNILLFVRSLSLTSLKLCS